EGAAFGRTAPEAPEASESSDYSDGLGLVVGAEAHGQRLDRFLSQWFGSQSRARLQQWIAAGAVAIDGQPARKSSQPVKQGQSVWAIPPEPEPSGDWLAESIPLAVVYEDEDILVVNKQAGLVVHPAAGHATGTLLNGLLWHQPGLRHLPRAGIVHRLDRDTTGLMVVAKTLEAQTDLVRQLQARSMGRQYLALAWGAMNSDWVAQGSIGRDPADRQRMAVVGGGVVGEGLGKPAWTAFAPLAHGTIGTKPVTLLRCGLKTGRTHQIRVHLEYAKAPIVGDPSYRRTAPRPEGLVISRQALHAYALSLRHPTTGADLQFQAAPPVDFLAQLSQAGIPWPL
ncbi:MAG: RluA family pseudouridine synthase, partial [Burkholderiaceae bacterium]